MSEKQTLKEFHDEIVSLLNNEKLIVDIGKLDAGQKAAGVRFRKEMRAITLLIKESVKRSLGKGE
jgi:hypothetical protein